MNNLKARGLFALDYGALVAVGAVASYLSV